jgi:hypothetical protein
MRTVLKNFSVVFVLSMIAGISACTVGNKAIPDPNGNIGVDTSGNIGTFFLNVTGDTSYLLTVVAADTVINDSLLIIGADLTTQDQVIFTTASTAIDTFYADQSVPGKGTVFVFRKRNPASYSNYAMLKGTVIITAVNTTTKVLRGKIDVNNEGVPGADKTYYLKGNFTAKID